MSNCLQGAGAGFLSELDFHGAIAACTAVIAPHGSTPPVPTAPAPAPTPDDYLCRAYARCFAAEKDNANYDKAIADCSLALSMIKQNSAKQNCATQPGTARRIRAFASYLKGDYAGALSDCKWALDPKNAAGSDDEDKSFARELLAKIRLNKRAYEQTVDTCTEAIPDGPQPAPNMFPTLSLAETYREACQKLRED